MARNTRRSIAVLPGAVEHPVKCLTCGTRQPLATSIKPYEQLTPINGDYSICWRCGTVLIFDDTRSQGVRRPTRDERNEIAADPDIQEALAAWRVSEGNR
jgi:hypothetical protein